MRIYKYPIQQAPNTHGSFLLKMPNVHQFLDVKEQSGVRCIWAIVDETSEITEKEFRIIPTGGPVPSDAVFIKTFHQSNFVWHLFQQF